MKYIIMDLDDTLLRTNKDLSPYSINILNRVRRLGYLIIFNTARSYLSTMPYMRMVRPDYTILNGGVEICDKDFNIIYKSQIDKSVVNEIIGIIKEDKSVLNYSIQADSGLYCSDIGYVRTNKLCMYKSFNEEFNEAAYKILVKAENKTKWINIAKKYNLEYECYLNGLWNRLCKADKHKGNLKLYSILNDNNPESIIFGDDRGDIEMISNATLGIYMKNTNKEIKIDGILKTKYDNDHDGVARFLEDYLLKESI